jgi:hypothetical protein
VTMNGRKQGKNPSMACYCCEVGLRVITCQGDVVCVHWLFEMGKNGKVRDRCEPRSLGLKKNSSLPDEKLQQQKHGQNLLSKR